MESLGALLEKVAKKEDLDEQEQVALRIQANEVHFVAPLADRMDAQTGAINDLRVGNIRIGPAGFLAGIGHWGDDFTGLRIAYPGTYSIAGYDGQVLQWGVDGSGSLLAGAGAVLLDADGITIKSGEATTESIMFRIDLDGAETGRIYSTTAHDLHLHASLTSSVDTSNAILRAYSDGSGEYNWTELALVSSGDALDDEGELIVTFVEDFEGGGAHTYEILHAIAGSESAGLTVFNLSGDDINFSVRGGSSANLFWIDGGTDSVQIGTSVVGAIADFSASAIVFNEAGAALNIRWEGGSATQLLTSDATADSIGIGTTTAGAIASFASALIVFNEGSADLDFRVESDGNENILFVNGGTNKVGIGTASPEGLLQITESGSAALSLPGTAADYTLISRRDGAVENNNRVLIAAGNAAQSILQFGDVNDGDIGAVTYDHSDNSMILRTNNGTRVTITSAGNVTVSGTLTVSGDQSGAADHVFDNYNDIALLEKWRAGKKLPFDTGDMLNRDRLLRDTIIQLHQRIKILEEETCMI